MTFQLIENRESRSSTNRPPTETLVYSASGSNDAAFVRAIATSSTAQTIATTMGILHRQQLDVEPVGYNNFTVIVPYGQHARQTGQWTFDFDTTGGTVHITTAISNRNKYPAGAENEELIGFDGENVAGVNKIIPTLRLNVTFNHPAGDITIDRVKTLADLTGQMNSGSFLGFSAGEVLFLGARGSDGSEAEAAVSYQFAMSSNATGLSIGQILGVEKKGHDYLWVRYRKKEAGGKPVGEVEFVYVDQIYNETDLGSVLGFG